MKLLQVTEELGLTLKKYRIDNNKSSKDVAKQFNKSPSYISKLESGDIKKIEFSLLYNIVLYISDQDDNEKSFDKFIELFKDKLNVIDTKESLENRCSFYNFDGIMRKIPVDKDLILHAKELMENNDISIVKLIDTINRNEDLDVISKSEFEKLPINIWSVCNKSIVIRFDLPVKDIENILSLEKDRSCYTYLQVIFYSLYKLIGIPKDEAKTKAINTLNEYKVYSISSRDELLEKSKTNKQLELLLSDFDLENRKLSTAVLEAFKFMSTIDVKSANIGLTRLEKNLTTDLTFAFAFISLDITNIASLDSVAKRQFIKDIKNFIQDYGTNHVDSDHIIYDID